MKKIVFAAAFAILGLALWAQAPAQVSAPNPLFSSQTDRFAYYIQANPGPADTKGTLGIEATPKAFFQMDFPSITDAIEWINRLGWKVQAITSVIVGGTQSYALILTRR